MANAVKKVVLKCQEAEENEGHLDLSHCQLVQVPDAIYYMMRETPLVSCNLSHNVITKIPPKFAAKFSFIKKLNLSQNRMSALPEELSELSQLESVDISHNSFVSLPECLFSLPKVTEIKANNNFVAEVDADLVSSAPRLEHLNLLENPLSRACEDSLAALSADATVKVAVSERKLEDWEDLEI